MSKIIKLNEEQEAYKKMAKKAKRVYTTAHEILKAMYKEVEPTQDFEFLVKIYKDSNKTDWNKDYYLRISRQLGIIDTYCKSNKLTYYEKMEVLGLIHDFVPRAVEGRIESE